MISTKFKTAVKLHHEPAYKIAQQAGVNPCTLSKLICGIIPVQSNDERVVAIGKELGLDASECFEGGPVQ